LRERGGREAGDLEEAEARFVRGREDDRDGKARDGSQESGFHDGGFERGDLEVRRISERLVDSDGKASESGEADEIGKGGDGLFEVLEVGRGKMGGESEGLIERPGAVAIDPESVAARILFDAIDCLLESEAAEFEFERGAAGPRRIEGAKGNAERGAGEGSGGAGEAEADGGKFWFGAVDQDRENFLFRLQESLLAEAGERSDLSPTGIDVEEESFAAEAVSVEARYHIAAQKRIV
jgi:hypothetical protein